MKHLGQCLLVLTGLLTSLGAMTACGGDAPPMGEALKHRDSMAVMVTSGCSMLYSDSGRVQFKVIAEQWEVYDKTTPPRHVFAKGLYLQRFSRQFTPDLYVIADTAFLYNQNLWDVRGHVFLKDFARGMTFKTSQLYWDLSRHEFWTDRYVYIVTPDRTIEGDHFRSNEEMTRYSIRQTSGYMPAPQESEGGAGTANIPPEPTAPGDPTTETADTLPQIIVPPRTQPRPRNRI